MDNLNEAQKRAVEAPAEVPLLIVAGAGTGKTKALTTRISAFIKSGVPGDQILAVTFTNKAAKEMLERVERILKAEDRPWKSPGKPLIGTFHAIGARILRSHARLAGRTPDFVIFDDNDSFALVKKILKDLDRKKESAAGYASAISAFKNEGREPDKPLARAVLQKYEESLEGANAFDFDDLLVKTVAILKMHPHVLQKYRDRFTHILVDEYQDINAVQYEFIRLLARPSGQALPSPGRPPSQETAEGRGVGHRSAGGPGQASLSVVGDAEQTIYGWRGSDIEIFLRFPEDWPGAHMVTLTQNYRSTKNILAAAAGVIKKNVYDTNVERATDLWTENPEGDRVVLRECYTEDDEAWWIAEKVASGENRAAKEGQSNALRTTAVLYRTNAQSRALEQALLAHRIPYIVYGGLKFYERREIRDVIAGLRLALNPEESMSRDRLEKALSKRAVRGLLLAFAEEGGASPTEYIDCFLRMTNYFSYMERSMTNPRDRRENIEELVHFAGKFTALPPLLEEVALLQATDSLAKEERDRAVSLMTVHLAKGLEFDRVFIAGAAEGLLPHERSIMSASGVQEERRLMYVAMTRARSELLISFYNVPSRFLGEIPEETVRFETAEGRKAAPDFRDDEYEERYISLD